MTPLLAGAAAGFAGIGLAQALAATRLVTAFATRARQSAAGPAFPRPPVTVLKPLHGDEPLLPEALASLCRQDYPDSQIVFGVQHATDPALAVVEQVRARFPQADVSVVIDPAIHGPNRKVGNLINMLPAARHDILVIADSDVHVRPDYLGRLVTALLQPGVGLVTTLYAGLPATRTASAGQHGDSPSSRRRPDTTALPTRLGATQITHGFLPGALLARALGRQDCLGATMALRRHDLDRIGGFHALVGHLADDNVLGRRIAGLGLRVALADILPLTTVPEAAFRPLFRHELRWARTIRALEPVGFAASILQYPLAWALLAILLSAAATWSLGLFVVAWILRAIAARAIDTALAPLWADHPGRFAALAFSCPVWLLPLRDVFSVAVMLASYGGRRVDWRGHGLHADTPPPPAVQPTQHSATFRPIEGMNLR
jgi:ceramide glucosyltransferase